MVGDMSVLIIDYGMGNLRSVRTAFEACGADVMISSDPGMLSEASHAVLPGVGAFPDAMRALRETGWSRGLRKMVCDKRIPLLGICLGMQLLADFGTENGRCEGLGLIHGEVDRMLPTLVNERIPHVGWNELWKKRQSRLLQGVEDGTDFYFVHSYHLTPAHADHVIATTPYCGGIVSAVENGLVMGVQFHPEKSHRPGFQIIRNFLSIHTDTEVSTC